MKQALILGAAGRDFHNSDGISRDISAHEAEKLTKSGLAELLARRTHEHEPAPGGVGK